MTQEMIIPEPPSDEQVVEAVEEVEEEESPTMEANGDDFSDLFEAPDEDDPDMRCDDLLDVDLETDVMDGDLSDLTTVTNEDVMDGPRRSKKKKMVRTARPYQYVPPTRSIGTVR